MKALIDGDILRYEIGYAAETGWRAITETDDPPPFEYVETLLLQRINNILNADEAINSYCLILTKGRTFRYDIAVTKPYKGTRKEKKPWHFDNLTAYIEGVLPSKTVEVIEADDAMAIEHCDYPHPTIICSRDKDLRQVPGPFYSWELGRQPGFGPTVVDKLGTLELNNGKLKGTGFAFFCSQMLTGDIVDNIPGIPGIGPKKAYDILNYVDEQEWSYENKAGVLLALVEDAYKEHYEDEWEERHLEQGQLCWMVRKLDDEGKPVLWQRGMYE
jgi:5'-3' exonuclease